MKNSMKSNLLVRKGDDMKRFLLSTVLACAAALTGCSESQGTIRRVQTNLVEKSIFDGEWWYARTTIDVDTDEAYIVNASGGFAPWSGDMSYYDIALNQGTMARIRWVIDENYLFAYRSYEIIAGGNGDGNKPGFRGQPLAAFKIDAHVNVQREYNTVSGEQSNVVVENGSDTRWYETKYMRVDWSQNLIQDFYIDSIEEQQLFNTFHQESVPFHIQEGSAFPKEWAPQFVTVGEDTACASEEDKGKADSSCYRFGDEWDATADADTVHYMSFVTQEVWTPSSCTSGGCTPINVTRRNAFLRVPPNHEYATETVNNQEFDRFGILRSEQRTYIRGGESTSDVYHHYCDGADQDAANEDCGAGGHCDLDQHICTGGLTEDYGETDFLSFYRLRHNFYSDSLTDTDCRADWECDGRYSDTSDPAKVGSVCDRSAHRCTVPLAQRTVRPVAYHLNPHFPSYLVRSAFQVIGSWNEVFMKGQRSVTGVGEPSGPAVACQSKDPTQYCFCGTGDADGVNAPEVGSDGTCAWKYDPFQTPEAATAAGVENPYDCYIEHGDSADTDLDAPQSFADYNSADPYNYHFKGSECMFVLKANSCDLDPNADCEQLGDIRYQFFNYITHGSVPFCGVMEPLQDPTNGEAVVSPANMSGECLEQIGRYANSFFPVLRGDVPEDYYFDAENIRGYFARLGRVQEPPSVARSGTDGYTVNDTSRPGLPVDAAERAKAWMNQNASRFERLYGTSGRAAILQDRLGRLAGTDIESRLVHAMGVDGQEAISNMVRPDRLQADTGMNLDDQDVMDQVSPFRDNFLNNVTADQRRWQILEKRGYDPAPNAIFTSRYWAWWARAFAGREVTEADVRMRQAYLRGVMLHEVGHAIGLEHNFAASLDRNNYQTGYYNVVRDVPLPTFTDYDKPSMGGDNDSHVTGPEVDRYVADLRRARNERSARGAGNVMASSIMEYPGDLSDMSGLGKYDTAATVWNYFNQYEAYTAGDPTIRTCTADTECGPGGRCVSDPDNSDRRICDQDDQAQALDGLHWGDQVGRTFWTYYRGGDSCTEDAECPYSSTDSLASGQAIHQRCLKNARYSNTHLPAACGADDKNCICSNFDEDFDDYVAGAAFRDRSDNPEYFPTRYLFCTNGRDNDLSWCSTFDAGESFREVIDHFRRGWEEGYPSSYFRRYRRNFYPNYNSLTGVMVATKIYQHLFYRYFYEPGFTSNQGALGWEDQYFASVDAMNWLIELSQLPDVGSYQFDEDNNIYRKVSDDPEADGADFALLPGQGFYTWSAKEEGVQGYFRYARSGVFWDKYLALLALALRDWGLSYTLDERYYLNFYDLFPVEMTEFFGGMVIDNPRWFAPRINMDEGSPIVQHMNFFRDSCLGNDGNYYPCRGSSEDTYPAAAIDSTSNDVLRDWAAVLTLATFPVFYDTSFQQRLSIWKLGNGDGLNVPDTRPDGSPLCQYGTDGCDDPGYILYNSDRLHTTYVATRLQSRYTYNLEEEQLGFQLLRELTDLQEQAHVLEAVDDPSPDQVTELAKINRSIQRNESFLDNLIEIQHEYGISSWL